MPADALASEAIARASEDIVDLYDRHAADWLHDRGTDLHERAWLDRFVAQLPAGAHILDVGCGTGEPIARHLIDHGFQVTGIDSSPNLIAIAAERLPAAEWMVQDMRALDLASRFHGVIAWHSFFHLTPAAQRAMFPRFAGHVRPGGTLMFTSGAQEGEVVGDYRGEPLYHGSLAPEEYRALLSVNGFEVLSNIVDDPDCGHSTVWLARCLPT